MPVSLSSQQGMLSRGAAYALIAEVALHGAAYIESGQNEYYATAKKASEDLLPWAYMNWIRIMKSF